MLEQVESPWRVLGFDGWMLFVCDIPETWNQEIVFAGCCLCSWSLMVLQICEDVGEEGEKRN